MKKTFLCLVLILLWCASAYGFDGGDGTVGNPWQVATADHLHQIGDPGDANFPNYLDDYFIQTADIDLTGYDPDADGSGWAPIGDTTNKFTGSYDGDLYLIENLTINRPNTDDVGLFGHVGRNNAEIKNVRIEGVSVTGATAVGSLIGRVTGDANTLIEMCYAVNGTVTGDRATGGLIGSHNSYTETPGGTSNPILSKSYADIDVFMSGKAGVAFEKIKFGGLAGCMQKGTINNSFARGAVDTTAATATDPAARVGGLAGCNELRGEINKSYSTGEIIVNTHTTKVGGLIGNVTASGGGNDGVVNDSFWDMDTSGQPTSAGGTGKTTAEMKDIDTFTDTATVGLDDPWDFTAIWAIDDTETINDGYPYLQGTQQPLAIVLSSFSTNIAGDCIEVEWETATEIDTIGFYLWRSEKRDSGYIQIDDSYTLSKSPMETIGARYAYTDCEVEINETARYYYELEELEMGDTVASLFYGPIGPVSNNTETASGQRLPASEKSSGGSGNACFIGTLKEY